METNGARFYCFELVFSALRFQMEPQDVVAPEGSSVLLPCEGTIFNKQISKDDEMSQLIQIPNIRWRGPDGQDIGIVGDTFRWGLFWSVAMMDGGLMMRCGVFLVEFNCRMDHFISVRLRIIED